MAWPLELSPDSDTRHDASHATIRWQRLKRAYRVLSRGVSAAAIDRILNVDTAQRLDLAQLGLDAPERVSYEAAGWRELRRILRPAEVSGDDVFLDLGSGKGRMILLAARYRFRRVIGVEIAEPLMAVARRNAASCRLRRRCGGIELVNADVLHYQIPDDVSVVYMFNPFGGAVFDIAVAQLIASVDRRPRRVRVIYRNGRNSERLTRTGRFRLVRESLGLRPGRAWREATAVRLFELGPRAPAGSADERHTARQAPSEPADERHAARQAPSQPADERHTARQAPSEPADERHTARQAPSERAPATDAG
jgi:SAM-dependent methyltransferase